MHKKRKTSRKEILFLIRRIGNKQHHNIIHHKISWSPFLSNIDPKLIGGFAFATLFILSFVFSNVGITPSWLSASILQNQAPAWDGTVQPLKKTLNWAILNSDDFQSFKAGKSYETWASDKIIDLPKYDTTILAEDIMKTPYSQTDKRNTMATYITAYMGKYTGGGEPAIEYAGSHVGVDIRASKGTPVYAVANGVVSKTKPDDGTVVIKHSNVPNKNNLNKLDIIYSNYLHMSKILVKQGDIVLKGQEIGKVGMQGLASTYHLHFQVDNALSPYQPYWPFTWNEVKIASTDFFTAVDDGMGADNGKKYTINPLKWVVENINTKTSPVLVATATTDTSDMRTAAPEPTVVSSPAAPATNPTLDITLVPSDTFVLTNSQLKIKVNIKDNPKLARSLIITVNPSPATTVSPSSINTSRDITFVGQNAGKYTIKISDGISTASTNIQVVDKIEAVANFSLSADNKYYHKGKKLNIKIKTIDRDGNNTPAKWSGTVFLKASTGNATFVPASLSYSDFENGVASVVATSNTDTFAITSSFGETISQPLALELIPFADISAKHSYLVSILDLASKKVVKGYDDGTYKPNKEVNRAEALKMLISRFAIPSSATQITFTDVPVDAWFAKYVQTAVGKGIAKGYKDGTFAPAKSINRAEFLKIVLIASNKEIPSKVENKPYADVPVDAWFASYAQYAKKNNLFPNIDENLDAGANITRGEVAEVIYRVANI